MMTSSLDSASPFTEDWNTYRKLVIDTLRRLDERTLEFHDSIADIKTKIALLEDKDLGTDLKSLEQDVYGLRDDFIKFKSASDTKDAANNAARRVTMIVGGVFLTIANIIITALINGWADNLF